MVSRRREPALRCRFLFAYDLHWRKSVTCGTFCAMNKVWSLSMQARLLPVVLITALLFACVLSQYSKSAMASSAGKIVPTNNMLAARASHTATLLPDGRVLITGGMVENGVFLDSMEVYDPLTGQFAAAGHMSSKRVGHSATLLPTVKF